MAQFFTRVELHYGSGTDYEVLHREMGRRNFLRSIVASDGKAYQLPTAMYYSHGDLAAHDVRELAKAAAETTGRKYWILTSSWDQAAWYLNEAQA